MSLKETIQARVKSLLRSRFQINTAQVTAKTALGDAPIGFEDLFINTEFRPRTNDFFGELASDVDPGTWDWESSVGDVADDIIDDSGIKTAVKYETRYVRN